MFDDYDISIAKTKRVSKFCTTQQAMLISKSLRLSPLCKAASTTNAYGVKCVIYKCISLVYELILSHLYFSLPNYSKLSVQQIAAFSCEIMAEATGSER